MTSSMNYHPHRFLEFDCTVVNDEHVSTSIAILLLALAASEVVILLLCKAMAWYADVVFYSQDWTANKESLDRSPKAIAKSLNTIRYEQRLDAGLVSNEETTCPICLIEFETNDAVSHGKTSCQKHTFHAQCITQWLTKHSTCPCCRQEMLAPTDTTSSLWQQQVDAGLDPSFCLFVF